MSPKYRPDIDGLRAIAVLAVLFFHADFSLFSGGYVGVDIFFVISGYLITTIIVREIEQGTFSIANFYERRFRRILPALIVVLVVSLIIGSVLLSNQALIDLGESAIAASLFSSNMLFYFEAGYFGGAAELKPLLHTWSLAVEEQYYIFFPLLCLCIAKFGKSRYFLWLMLLSLLSLIASIIITKSNPSAAYYWIPTRAWELFIGSLVAIQSFPLATRRLSRELMTLIGFVMLLISIFVYTEATPFPSYTALLPTVGTALIIHAGISGDSFVARFLSIKPMVFIGLLSYSLYLWHWPIIVYTKIWTAGEIPTQLIWILIVLMFVLSYLSLKWVEAPFRKNRLASGEKVASYLPTRSAVFSASIKSSLAIILAGAFLILLSNAGGWKDFDLKSVFADKDPEWSHWRECEDVVKRLKSNKTLCFLGDREQAPTFLFWGDSHGRALASGMNQAALDSDVSGYIATQSACPPLIGVERPNRTECAEFNQAIIDFVQANNSIEKVFLTARWPLIIEGTRYKEESGNDVELIDLISSEVNLDNAVIVEKGLIRTLEFLKKQKKHIILINSVPEIGYEVPVIEKQAELKNENLNEWIAPSLNEFYIRSKRSSELLSQLQSEYQFLLINPAKALCNEEICFVEKNNIILYRDDDHLSTEGSKLLSPLLQTAFK